jgi:hypothetical protein
MIQPLQRLKVNDGLLLTAEGWRIAHDYHRQRQNIHFQSLHQPGIVWGLGICIISPPSEVAEEYRDERWLQIQPGVAIDYNGNPIVVPEPLAFRIASEAPLSGNLMVYIAINYVDPDRLQGLSDRPFVQETFRIDEKTTVPLNTEIELCRVLLEPGEVKLKIAADVLNPKANQLDLLKRKQAQVRSLQEVRVAQIVRDAKDNTTAFGHFSDLVQSIPALYPAMQATVERLKMPSNRAQLDYDLLYFDRQHLLSLSETERQVLSQYLADGAVVLVEVSVREANIVELSAVQQQLQNAIAQLHGSEGISIRQELEAELEAVNVNIEQHLQEIISPMHNLTTSMGIDLGVLKNLDHNNFIRRQPFLFAQLPTVQGSVIRLFNWGGILIVVGSLSCAWGIDGGLSLQRETIRNAQEMGINILHFAWQKHYLTQLQILNN